MQFFEDKLSPTLWCVSGVENEADQVIVRFVWSRGTAATITTALKPLAAATDLFDRDPKALLLSNVAELGVALDQTQRRFVVQPLGEYSFKFDREDLNELYRESPDQPLIEVSTHLGFVAMGLAYDELKDLAGPLPAGILVLGSSQDCVDVLSGLDEVDSAINTVIECLGSVSDWDGVAQKFVDAGLVKSSEELSGLNKTARQAAKKLKSLLRFFVLAQTTQKLSSALADAHLNEINRQLTYTPSLEELLRIARAEQTREFKSCEDVGSAVSYGTELPASGCITLTPLPFEHPLHGQAKFVLGLSEVDGWPALTYWLLDSADQVISRRKGSGDIPWSLNAPTLDGSGNIIHTYNPGRSDGCVALRPQDDWFEGFGTDPMQVPEGEPDYATRFYGCTWTDEDGDGANEIVYQPSGGATYVVQPEAFVWDGEDYVFAEYRPLPDGSWLPGYGPNS